MTDVAGKYEISELPAGRYNLSATKDGYVQLSYGQLRPFRAGKPLQLNADQVLERIDFALPRGGIIAGRVTDEYGDPVANSNVQALQLRFVNGRKVPTNVGLVSVTWDNGEFRLWGLNPGDYLISASPSGMAGSAVARNDHVGYAPSYYPNTANPSEAHRVVVAVGQVVSNITIGLVATRTADIAGTVTDIEGRPANGGQVTLAPRDTAGILMRSAGLIRPDGTFTIPNVPPGDYVVRAGLPPSSPTGQPQFADAPVTVNGEDITDLRLVPRLPVTVRGRLTVDQGSQSAGRPIPFMVAARPLTPEGAIAGGPTGSTGIVREDHTFEFNTFPGPILIQVGTAGPSPGLWTVRAISLHGQDVTDTGFDIRSGEDVTGLEIDLTTRIASASGLVTNVKGEQVSDYTMVVFPQERELWRTPMLGRNAIASPDQEGRFQVRAIRPGQYFICAIEYLDEPGQTTDPDYLDRLSAKSSKFSLAESEDPSRVLWKFEWRNARC